MIFGLATKEDVIEYERDMDIMKTKIANVQDALEKKPDKLDKDAYERLADLEVKMAKLWGLLVETNAYGKDKLTKHGKFFGGAMRGSL